MTTMTMTLMTTCGKSAFHSDRILFQNVHFNESLKEHKPFLQPQHVFWILGKNVSSFISLWLMIMLMMIRGVETGGSVGSRKRAPELPRATTTSCSRSYMRDKNE